MSKKIKITLAKSTIGCLTAQKRTVAALGLRRIRHEVVHNDTAVVRGMIEIVKHLVVVQDA
jgi:large subunit ribosomal protein L30